MGISGWHLLRRSHVDFFRRSFDTAIVFAVIGTLGVTIVGHNQAQHMIRSQPMKMAAAEALWESENPASFSLFTFGNEPERRDVFAIRIPGLLSLLAFNRFDGEVKGVKDLQAEYERQYGPGNYVPPVAVTYWSFRFMVAAGMLMIVLALYGLYPSLPAAWRRNRSICSCCHWRSPPTSGTLALVHGGDRPAALDRLRTDAHRGRGLP